MSEQPEPNLGCATTRQLLEELWARLEVDGRLDYRTVDDEWARLEVDGRLDYRTVDDE